MTGQLSLGAELVAEPVVCPCEGEHEPGPEDVNEWIAWADARLAAGHTQHACEGCGRPLVWRSA